MCFFVNGQGKRMRLNTHSVKTYYHLKLKPLKVWHGTMLLRSKLLLSSEHTRSVE